MVKEYANKNLWALILGGSRGLGLASAHKMASHGLNIIIVYRDRRSESKEFEEEVFKMKQNDISVLTFNADAMSPEKRSSIIEELKENLGNNGKIKLLLHSIAKGNLKPMYSENQPTLANDDFNLTINAMGLSLYDWFKAIFDVGLFAEQASVISFTSEGNTRAWANYGAVSAAKVVLEAITRNIALEFARCGIRANCLQAGITETASSAMIPGFENIKNHALNRNPVGRLTSPQDVANAVYLLCRDEAAWINGCVIPVDGGEHIS